MFSARYTPNARTRTIQIWLRSSVDPYRMSRFHGGFGQTIEIEAHFSQEALNKTLA